jgi:hypothetical protein
MWLDGVGSNGKGSWGSKQLCIILLGGFREKNKHSTKQRFEPNMLTTLGPAMIPVPYLETCLVALQVWWPKNCTIFSEWIALTGGATVPGYLIPSKLGLFDTLISHIGRHRSATCLPWHRQPIHQPFHCKSTDGPQLAHFQASDTGSTTPDLCIPSHSH